MKQSLLLFETLKRHLKLKGITYRELAERLGQSESNVKRIFSQKAVSLGGLEEICEAAGLELLDLARMSRPAEESAQVFSKPQEEGLAKSPELFAFFYVLLSGLSLAKIVERYAFSRADCTKYLLQLDKLGLIRLHASDRFQLLTSRNIRWMPDGPLNRLYREEIKKEFMESRFSGPSERLRLLSGRLSPQSLQTLSRRLDRLIAEFAEFTELDQAEGTDSTRSIWLVLAYRPWSFSIVDRYRRKRG